MAGGQEEEQQPEEQQQQEQEVGENIQGCGVRDREDLR